MPQPTIEELVTQAESVYKELEDVTRNYLEHSKMNARVFAILKKKTGETFLSAPGKNAAEREAYVDIHTNSEQEDQMVWSSIVKADDHRIRSLQSRLGIIRSLISAIERESYRPKEPKELPVVTTDFVLEEETDDDKPDKDIPF